ncbi:MAG: recombinase family protein [Planctomycetes bacterium]|nr:recombinase family protein [Planctomycetota bacterium]
MTRSSRSKCGRAEFYFRDSGGRHECTPAQYVAWAASDAKKRGLKFGGTSEQIERMIKNNIASEGDLFLDYDVSGNLFVRRGLDALVRAAQDDPTISHIYIPRRDRLARPEDPLDGVRMENVLREMGLTLVFMDRGEVGPISKGGKRDLGDLILSLVDYDASGKFAYDLAHKMVLAQIELAKGGFSTGGRPPYGFRRWLVREDGTPVRELQDREHVRMAGHHVVWLPGPEEELSLIRRILELLEANPASRVAAMLNKEGVPSPDAGRSRKDRGFTHQVSGLWNQSTIISIARNTLLNAVVTFGRRSMGRLLRTSPDGARELAEHERLPDQKVKVVQNPPTHQITAPATFDPLVSLEKLEGLRKKLDARAGSQKGKPRSRNPEQNPLGCRVFDLNCGWPMYRAPYEKTYRYKCGQYMQSHGARCFHNSIDGPMAQMFVLASIQQRFSDEKTQQRIRRKIERLAAQRDHGHAEGQELGSKEAQLADISRKLETITENMALAETPEQRKAMATIFDCKMAEKKEVEAAIQALKLKKFQNGNRAVEVEKALTLLDRLCESSKNMQDSTSTVRLFNELNVRLFLRFEPTVSGKRMLNTLVGGLLTMGAAAMPITPYEGPTARKDIKPVPVDSVLTGTCGDLNKMPPREPEEKGREVGSLRNVGRGDRI